MTCPFAGGRRFPHADAQSRKFRTLEMGDKGIQTVMSSRTTGGLQADPSRRQVQVIGHDQYPVQWDIAVFGEGYHGPARFVHEGLGEEQEDLTSLEGIIPEDGFVLF